MSERARPFGRRSREPLLYKRRRRGTTRQKHKNKNDTDAVAHGDAPFPFSWPRPRAFGRTASTAAPLRPAALPNHCAMQRDATRQVLLGEEENTAAVSCHLAVPLAEKPAAVGAIHAGKRTAAAAARQSTRRTSGEEAMAEGRPGEKGGGESARWRRFHAPSLGTAASAAAAAAAVSAAKSAAQAPPGGRAAAAWGRTEARKKIRIAAQWHPGLWPARDVQQ